MRYSLNAPKRLPWLDRLQRPIPLRARRLDRKITFGLGIRADPVELLLQGGFRHRLYRIHNQVSPANVAGAWTIADHR